MKGYRKFTFVAMLVLFAFIATTGCSRNPESVVKEGSLQLDSSVTVGDALDGYEYFGDTEWDSFEDSQKRRIVEFHGMLDFDLFAGSEFQGTQLTAEEVEKAKDKLGDMAIRYEAQFYVSKDGESFQLKYSGVHMSGTNKETGEKMEEDMADDEYVMIQHIYANQPEPSTWGLLFATARQ